MKKFATGSIENGEFLGDKIESNFNVAQHEDFNLNSLENIYYALDYSMGSLNVKGFLFSIFPSKFNGDYGVDKFQMRCIEKLSAPIQSNDFYINFECTI